MNKYNRKINFSAGPSTLNVEVLENIKNNLLNYNNEGLSVLEMSHRSQAYMKIHQECENILLELMKLNKNEWQVLLLQGGASLQFEMIPINLLNSNKKAAYVINGVFSTKAFKAAKKIYNEQVYVCSDSTENSFTKIEDWKNWKIDEENTAYIHMTTNNTVYGLAKRNSFPKFKNIPIVADMSSNILSEDFNYENFDLIYAGAQKNLGCAGLTVVVLRKSLLEKINDENIPSMLSYKVHAKADSEYNTPPAFAIYVAYENLKWLKKITIKEIEKRNIVKSNLLYETIDNSDFYINNVNKENRSIMNIIFKTPNPELDKKFIQEAKDNNIISISGYSLIGGMRASCYNGMDINDVEVLVNFMKKFEKANK